MFFDHLLTDSGKYHVRELYTKEFEDLLQRYFENVKLLTQQMVFGSVIAPVCDPSGLNCITGDFNGYECTSGLPSPMYNICLASSEPLPQFGASIFLSNIERSYIMQDKLERIATLEQRLHNLSTTIGDLQGSFSLRLGRMITAPIRWLSR